MDEQDTVPVALTRHQWGVVQQALDEYFYVVEHARPGGLGRRSRENNQAKRDELLLELPRLDASIAEQAGVKPIF